MRENKSITYSDNEGNIASFPNPLIEIECGDIIVEECPDPIDITIAGCNEYVEYDLGDIYLDSTGRILDLSLNLKSICPNKRVALAVIITEKDESDIEYRRGMKIMTIPAHQHSTCRDIKVTGIRFILPDDISLAELDDTLCEERRFVIRTMSHYVDSGFVCENVII